MTLVTTSRVYLDWNATTPPLAEVVEAMMRAATLSWANPSSVHGEGRRARGVVEDARAAVGHLAGADPRDVVFTSGATEANNLALTSALAAREGLFVTSRLEHPSVTRVAERFASRVRWLRVTREGAIDLEDFARAMDASSVAVVALQAVNHETGVIQPLREVIDLARARGAWMHVDAAQAWGKVAIDTTGASSVSVAPHKFRGPKGIGALALAQGVKLSPLLVGGAQEKGVRPGTVDPALAAGFAVAARHAASTLPYERLGTLRDVLEETLIAMGAQVNGAGRAPHVTSLAFSSWRGPELVAALDLEGVACSSGSACSAGTAEPSPVLDAMLGEARAASSVRLSMGETTSPEDIAFAISAFKRVCGRLK